MRKRIKRAAIGVRDSLDVLLKPGPLLYYTHIQNFGDLLNRDLYMWLFYREPANAFKALSSVKKSRMSAIGSHLSAIRSPHTLIWGTGFLSSELEPSCQLKNICAVRGPLSRKKLTDAGIECPENFGDPALLSPRVFGKPIGVKSQRVKLIPHFSDRNEACWEQIRQHHDCDLLDVRQSPARVVHEISTASVVVSSSLHGLIVGIAYGVPVVWYRPTEKPKGDGFKFLDFFEAIGCPGASPITRVEEIQEANPIELAFSSDKELIASQCAHLLSSLAVHYPEVKTERILNN